MWCPSATLSVWANAWLAGRAAPDDVLDALSLWAPTQSVAAHDAVAAGDTGLPWPDARDTGAVSLLSTVRGTARARAAATIHPVSPAPGDVRGLPAGTEFARYALAAGEAVIIADREAAIGLVPELRPDGADAVSTLCWTVYALPAPPPTEQHDLGQAEYAMRSAVRSAADALTTLGARYTGPDDPRSLIEQLLECARQHRIPDHAPQRAVRVLQSAAHIDAIAAVGAGVIGAETLRPLAAVVRSARSAALDTILRSAWSA